MRKLSNFENLSSVAFMRPSQPLSAFFIFSEILDTYEGQWFEKMWYLGHIAFKTITNCVMAFRISVWELLKMYLCTLEGAPLKVHIFRIFHIICIMYWWICEKSWPWLLAPTLSKTLGAMLSTHSTHTNWPPVRKVKRRIFGLAAKSSDKFMH